MALESYIELPLADGGVQRIRRYRYARYQVMIYDRRRGRYSTFFRHNDPDVCHDWVAICHWREHEDVFVIDQHGEVCE